MSEKQEGKRSTTMRKPYQKPGVVKIKLEARDVVLGCNKATAIPCDEYGVNLYS